MFSGHERQGPYHSRPQRPSFLGHVVLQIKLSGSGDENGLIFTFKRSLIESLHTGFAVTKVSSTKHSIRHLDIHGTFHGVRQIPTALFQRKYGISVPFETN